MSANSSFVSLCETISMVALLPWPIYFSWRKGNASRVAASISWPRMAVHVGSHMVTIARHNFFSDETSLWHSVGAYSHSALVSDIIAGEEEGTAA